LRPNHAVTNITNLIALRLDLIVSSCCKIMHGLYALSAKDRARTGTVSFCIKPSLTYKLSEISTACIGYTPPSPILTIHLSVTIISSHFGCQNELFWEICKPKLCIFVSLIVMCPSLRSFPYFTILTTSGDLNTLRIPQ